MTNTALVKAELQLLDTPAGARALANLESAVGGRDALVTALAHAPQDDALAYTINLISDPHSDARSLAALCRAGGITLGELLEAYKRGRYALMQVEVVHHIATHTPAVTEDVMTRAQPHWVTCYACRGTLLVWDTEAKDPKTAPKIPCTTCVNEQDVPIGKIYTLPDLDRQKLALEIANVLPKKAPLVVNNQAVSLPVGDASPAGFGKLLQAADAILRATPPPPRPEVIDAEVDPPSPPA